MSCGFNLFTLLAPSFERSFEGRGKASRLMSSHPRNSSKSAAYNLPYILPSSVSSNPSVFTLFTKPPGGRGQTTRKLLKFYFNSLHPCSRLSTALPSLCFQSLTTGKFCNSPVLITIQNVQGGYRDRSAGVKVLLELATSRTIFSLSAMKDLSLRSSRWLEHSTVEP